MNVEVKLRASPRRPPAAKTASPGNCRYRNPWSTVLANPTAEPSTDEDASTSTASRVPPVGSSGSVRVSRISPAERVESLTSGNSRSTRGRSADCNCSFAIRFTP